MDETWRRLSRPPACKTTVWRGWSPRTMLRPRAASCNREVATVFDTYVYDMGLAGVLTSPIGTTNYSYSATIGVFRSVVSLILVMGSNAIAKAAGEDGVY